MLINIALFISVFSVAGTIRLPADVPDSSAVDLCFATQVFSSKETDINPHQILSRDFKPMPEGPNFGVTDKVHWLKYDFYNTNGSSEKYVVFLPYHHIYRVHAWLQHGNSLKLIDSTGTFFRYNTKDIKSRGYPFIINFPPGKSTLLIKLNHRYMPLRGTPFMLTVEEARSTITRNETIIWFWRGIFMFALFVSFILYLSTKIRLFLYYFMLNFGVALFIGMEIGDFFMFFPKDPWNFIIDIKHLGNILVVLFFPLFLNELTPIARLRPGLWKIMMAGIIVMPVLWLICLIPPVKSSYFMLVTVMYFIFYTSLVFLLQIYFLAVAVYARKRNARVLFITYLFYISAVAMNVILPNLGVTTENLLVYNTLMIGSIIEIFTFMILMGRETLSIYRERTALINRQKKHKDEIIRAIVDSQEKERNKVGRELHDMIGANISVIRQNIDKSNTALLNVIDDTIESVRNLSHGLVTPMIRDDEFQDEIRELCLLFSNESLRIKSHFHGWKRISKPEVATHLYRIVQELLQNAVKHSRASSISIQFIFDESEKLLLIFEDNGRGFDYQSEIRSGLGLININNRVKLIHGSIKYDTRVNGGGTTVLISLPGKVLVD